MTTIIDFFISSLFKIICLFTVSISIRLLLQFFGQGWIKTTSHTVTLTVLPVITFIITTVISGNIALSLGMVGALSIVRFRNPVRSPLELTVYFTAITMGIAASVSLKWLLLLALSIYLVTLLLVIIFFISNKLFKKQFFISSFSEGNSLSTLEVTTTKKVKVLNESKFLKSIYFSKDGEKQYILASSNFNYLRRLITEIEDNESIIKYQLNEC